MKNSSIEQLRYFLKDSIRQAFDFSKTDQNTGVPPPPVHKPVKDEANVISLPPRNTWKNIRSVDILSAIEQRKSHRKYLNTTFSLEELSFLLWTTQGIRKQVNAATAYRNVPSAGSRHALETYMFIFRVNGLEPGVYRYIPGKHQLVFEFSQKNLKEKLTRAVLWQSFVSDAAVVFAWTTIPYRMEWRYHLASHKVIALDAGHVCQNLYLSCEAIGAGACAIAAYNQNALDQLLRIDGDDEFALYLAATGKIY